MAMVLVGNQAVLFFMNYEEFDDLFTTPLYFSLVSAIILSSIALIRVNIVNRSSILWYTLQTAIGFVNRNPSAPVSIQSFSSYKISVPHFVIWQISKVLLFGAFFAIIFFGFAAMYVIDGGDLGVENLREVERQVMLRIIDQRWREHLYEMDHLRDGIHLRAMAQKDPTTEWQREGFELFQELTEILRRDLVRYIMRVQVSSAEQEERIPEELETSGPEGPVSGAAAVAMAAGVPEEVKESRKIVTQQKVKDEKESTPRNAPCHCGSGRKFKHCHGR